MCNSYTRLCIYIVQNEKVALRHCLPSRDRFLRATRVDFFQLLVDTKASLLPNSLDKGRPTVPDKKASAPYLIEAMTIYVIGSDSLNCKLGLLVFVHRDKKAS